jgi:hypothetical protein
MRDNIGSSAVSTHWAYFVHISWRFAAGASIMIAALLHAAKGWPAEHSHDDDQVGHQLLPAIGQRCLVEAALLATLPQARRCSSGLRPARGRSGALVRWPEWRQWSDNEGRTLLHVPHHPPVWDPQLMGMEQTCACFCEKEKFFSPRCRLVWRTQNWICAKCGHSTLVM